MSERSVPKRQHKEEFKVEAVRLAEAVGQHEASRRLGVPVATVGNWSRCQGSEGAMLAESGTGAAAPSRRPVSDQEAENSRLRKELASAKLDIEILRKAAAYFAKGAR
jgi:transposase